MKTIHNVNILFVLNAGIVTFLSIGAAYFTILPMVMWERSIERIIAGATQNQAMIGLWLIYFTNIIFLPLTRKKKGKKWKTAYIVFLIGFIIFVIFILGLFDCGEAILSRFLGLDYNDRIRCLNEH